MLLLVGCAPHTTLRREPMLEGAQVRSVSLDGAADGNERLKVHVLVNEPALKLLRIVLHNGTELPEHVASVPVTIQAIQGQGTVIAGAERLPLDPSHAVVLGPNVKHAVQPQPGTDLVLLVHRSGRAE